MTEITFIHVFLLMAVSVLIISLTEMKKYGMPSTAFNHNVDIYRVWIPIKLVQWNINTKTITLEQIKKYSYAIIRFFNAL